MIGIKANRIYIYHLNARLLFVYHFLFNGIDHTAPGTSAYFFEVVTPLAIHWALSCFVFLSMVFTSSSSVQCIYCGYFVSVLDIFLNDCVKVFFASCKLLITTV